MGGEGEGGDAEEVDEEVDYAYYSYTVYRAPEMKVLPSNSVEIHNYDISMYSGKADVC